MEKQRYVEYATAGLKPDHRLFEAAIIFYHSEVDMADAKIFLSTLSKKLK